MQGRDGVADNSPSGPRVSPCTTGVITVLANSAVRKVTVTRRCEMPGQGRDPGLSAPC